jgi:hypothetical protein
LRDCEGNVLVDPILETENCKLETPSSFFRAWVQILVLFILLPLAAAMWGLYAAWDAQSFKLPIELAFASDLVILTPVLVQWFKWCAFYPRVDFTKLKFRVIGGRHELSKR